MCNKNIVGGHKTQVLGNEMEEDCCMNESEKGVDSITLNDVEMFKKDREAEKIAAIEEKLKGLKLAHQTDSFTIPVTKIKVDDLSVTMQPWDGLWENDKIDSRTPVIIERKKNVIAGPYQYFDAKENGLEQIDVVYIDSLKGKHIFADTLREQFQDEAICVSFAYNLYIALYDEIPNIMTYSEFQDYFDIFFEEDISSRINNYIELLDEAYGG